jgi:hypothetical protein
MFLYDNLKSDNMEKIGIPELIIIFSASAAYIVMAVVAGLIFKKFFRTRH